MSCSSCSTAYLQFVCTLLTFVVKYSDENWACFRFDFFHSVAEGRFWPNYVWLTAELEGEVLLLGNAVSKVQVFFVNT